MRQRHSHNEARLGRIECAGGSLLHERNVGFGGNEVKEDFTCGRGAPRSAHSIAEDGLDFGVRKYIVVASHVGISKAAPESLPGLNQPSSSTKTQNKMKPVIGIIGTAVMCALIAPTAARAQGSATPNGTGLPLTFTISATAAVQSSDSEKNNGKTDIVTSKTKVGKFSSTDVINTVEQANAATPTKNAKLVYDHGTVEVVDGANTYDASSFLTITLDPNSHSVWSGTDSVSDSNATETQSYQGHFIVTLMYDDGNGLQISVAGLATESYSIGQPDKNGNQTATDSISMSFIGDGHSGANGTVTGTFKASGKGTF
jgi:hypothetical protein